MIETALLGRLMPRVRRLSRLPPDLVPALVAAVDLPDVAIVADIKQAQTPGTAVYDATRSTGITWMALRGDERLLIMQRAGHAELKTTMGYIRTAEVLTGGVGAPFPELTKSMPFPIAIFDQSPSAWGQLTEIAQKTKGVPSGRATRFSQRLRGPGADGWCAHRRLLVQRGRSRPVRQIATAEGLPCPAYLRRLLPVGSLLHHARNMVILGCKRGFCT